MDTKTREYYAFGPWIYEIDDEHTMPSLFAPYYKQSEKPLMIFKIPRNIEFRNAEPTMDLYDYVIALFDTQIYMMKRNGKKVTEQTIAYSDIQAVQYLNDLLFAQMRFYTSQGNVVINYNAVSTHIIKKMAVVLSHKLSSDNPPILNLRALPYSVETIDFLYATLIGKIEQLNADATFVAYQPNVPYNEKKTLNIWRRRKRQLRGAAFVISEKALVVIKRVKDIRNMKTPDLSYSFLHLPYQNIKDMRISKYRAQIRKLRIITANHEFPILFTDKNDNIEELYNNLVDALSLRS